jgi:hypothetical protein
MTTTVVAIPRSLELENALAFSVNCAAVPLCDELVFDFKGVTNVEPFGMLLVSNEIRRLVQRCGNCKYGVVNHEGMRYAAHMGFFRAFGIEFGNAPGEAKGSPRYLPITILEREALERSAAQAGAEVGEEIEGRSKHLAQMLCGGESGPVLDTLAYALRELMRNVVEHSQAAELLSVIADSRRSVALAAEHPFLPPRSGLSHRCRYRTTRCSHSGESWVKLARLRGRFFHYSSTEQQ